MPASNPYTTTPTAVGLIIKTTLTTDEIQQFIDDADLWVTEELFLGGDAVLSTARLETIERYLTAAFIRVRELGLKAASIEGVTESYQVDPQVSDYLLRAASMDPTGRVRKQFLAPKTGEAGARKVIARVGQGRSADDLSPVSPWNELN